MAMRGIPNRGHLAHAWLKTCIDKKSTASLLWIEEESIANSIQDPFSMQELETPKKIDLSTPKPKTIRDPNEYPTPAESALSPQSRHRNTLSLETPRPIRLSTPAPKRQRNHLSNPTPAAFQRSNLKKQLFSITPAKQPATATPQISIRTPKFTPTPQKILSYTNTATSPAITNSTPSYTNAKTYADAAASPAAISKRTRLANTPIQPDRSKRPKKYNNDNKTPGDIRKKKARQANKQNHNNSSNNNAVTDHNRKRNRKSKNRGKKHAQARASRLQSQ